MGKFDPARQCTPTPQSAAGVTHEPTIPRKNAQSVPTATTPQHDWLQRMSCNGVPSVATDHTPLPTCCSEYDAVQNPWSDCSGCHSTAARLIDLRSGAIVVLASHGHREALAPLCTGGSAFDCSQGQAAARAVRSELGGPRASPASGASTATGPGPCCILSTISSLGPPGGECRMILRGRLSSPRRRWDGRPVHCRDARIRPLPPRRASALAGRIRAFRPGVGRGRVSRDCRRTRA